MPKEPIEVAFARLDERFQGFEKAFEQMVQDQRSLTESYQKLVESNQRIALLESEVAVLKESTKTLWSKFDAHIAAHDKIAGSALFEVAKLVAAVVIGAFAAHFGVPIH